MGGLPITFLSVGGLTLQQTKASISRMSAPALSASDTDGHSEQRFHCSGFRAAKPTNSCLTYPSRAFPSRPWPRPTSRNSRLPPQSPRKRDPGPLRFRMWHLAPAPLPVTSKRCRAFHGYAIAALRCPCPSTSFAGSPECLVPVEACHHVSSSPHRHRLSGLVNDGLSPGWIAQWQSISNRFPYGGFEWTSQCPLTPTSSMTATSEGTHFPDR